MLSSLCTNKGSDPLAVCQPVLLRNSKDDPDRNLIFCSYWLLHIINNCCLNIFLILRCSNDELLVTYFPAQQTWSGRTQQMLVPAWQQVTPMAAATTALTSEGVAGSQRLGDWG